jgi:hypothetical protein
LDDLGARAVGVLCGRASTADITDASVVLCARGRRHGIVTTDPEDLRQIDGDIPLFSPDWQPVGEKGRTAEIVPASTGGRHLRRPRRSGW